MNQSGVRLPKINLVSTMLGTLFLCSIARVAAEPRITDAILGQDRIDKANGYEIVKPAAELRPDNGWPPGSYRLEIYIGSTLAKTLKFSVTGS